MSLFKFKKFDIEQEGCAQKVGTDSMVLGSFVNHDNPKRILDIGTGNGILALMMAQKFEDAEITGVEIQDVCFTVAQSNFHNSNFEHRLHALNADFNSYEFTKKFDLIVSNPPFFENSMQSSSNERTISRHQSNLKISDLLAIAADNLMLNGVIWLIIPKESSGELIDKSEECGLKLFRRINIYGKPLLHKRDILAFIKTSDTIDSTQEDFTIRSNIGEYTDQYKAMTFDFHYRAL
jgi:tRNA1Val (adenine37-N6)-methyltransferase